VLTMLKLC